MYLDPSFGGMLIQIIIAIAVAGGALAFGMRKKISAFFNKKKNKNAEDSIVSVSSIDTADVIDVLDDA